MLMDKIILFSLDIFLFVWVLVDFGIYLSLAYTKLGFFKAVLFFTIYS